MIKHRKGTNLAYFLAIINAIVIGISFLTVKLTLDFASPFDTLTFRFAAAFIILLISALFGFVHLNYRGKPIYKLLPLATMYPFGFFTLQAFGLQSSTSAEGGIINAFTPAVTMVLAAIFLKEATSTLQKMAVFISISGVVFIFFMKGSSFDLSNMMGILVLLLACVAFSGYSVLTRSISKHFSTMEISCFMVGAGFAASLVISLTIHTSSGTLYNLVAPLANGAFLLLIFYLGIVQLATALMGNYILSKLEASKMSVFTNLSTVASIAAGALILGEKIIGYHIIGSILIIAGAIGMNLLARKKITPIKIPANG